MGVFKLLLSASYYVAFIVPKKMVPLIFFTIISTESSLWELAIPQLPTRSWLQKGLNFPSISMLKPPTLQQKLTNLQPCAYNQISQTMRHSKKMNTCSVVCELRNIHQRWKNACDLPHNLVSWTWLSFGTQIDPTTALFCYDGTLRAMGAWTGSIVVWGEGVIGGTRFGLLEAGLPWWMERKARRAMQSQLPGRGSWSRMAHSRIRWLLNTAQWISSPGPLLWRSGLMDSPGVVTVDSLTLFPHNKITLHQKRIRFLSNYIVALGCTHLVIDGEKRINTISLRVLELCTKWRLLSFYSTIPLLLYWYIGTCLL